MKTFEIRFYGKAITPENVRAGELADLLKSVEEIFFSVANKKHRDLRKEQLLISLVNLRSGSLEMQFSTALPEIVLPAVETFASIIARRDFQDFPIDAREPYEQFVKFLKNHEGQADILVKNGESRVLATITPELTLPEPAIIRGETVIYGEIVRVGGVRPKVEVKTWQGKTLFCDFRKNLASTLGSMLYKMVGLRGVAAWNSQTLELVAFDVQEVIEYQNTSLTESFRLLREAVDGAYDHVDNAVEYVSKLRRGDDE